MLSSSIMYISIPIIIVAYFFYFKDIFYGTTRPSVVSWFLWLLGPFIGVFFMLKAGAGISTLPVFFAGLGPLVVVIVLILKRNFIYKVTTFDLFCGLFSLLAIVLYVLTHNLNISILFAILSDLFAFIPTYTKAWEFPESENANLYYGSIINNILALLVITNWSFAIYSFSVYLILANLLLVLILYRKKIRFWYTT